MNKKYFFNQFAGIVGNILEHKDKALFVLLTPFIAPQFFPSDDYLVSLIEMYGIIVTSLFMRPLGAIVFGRMADGKGRKLVLMISIWGMALSTIGMGFIPTYSSIGYLAPMFLFLLRSAQNFFGAAETTNGAIYILEHSTKRRQAFVSSIFEASTMLGILLASLETTILAYFGWLESSWQWLFIIAGTMGLFCTIFRKKIEESPEFVASRFQLKEIWENRRILLSIALATGFSYATYLLSITFINGYLKATSPLDTLQLTSLNTFLTLFDLIALPFFGYVALFIPPARLMRIASFIMACLAIPLFMWMESAGSAWVVFVVRMVIVICGVCFAAPYRAWMQDLVPSNKRGTLLNVGSAIGQLFAEGPLTLFFLAALKQQLWLMPACMLAIFGFLTAYIVKEAKHKPILNKI